MNIVMVARFRSAHTAALRALAGLPGDFKLWFVGDGPTLPQVRAEVSRAGLTDRVVFLGARNDVPELLSQAHIFQLLASDYEGLPISILEAMRAALPVVASDVGGVCECVRQGSTGFLVPRSDLNLLRERLGSLIASSALRERMGHAGRALFEHEFTAEVMVQKTLAVYEGVFQTSPHRARLPGPAQGRHQNFLTTMSPTTLKR